METLNTSCKYRTMSRKSVAEDVKVARLHLRMIDTRVSSVKARSLVPCRSSAWMVPRRISKSLTALCAASVVRLRKRSVVSAHIDPSERRCPTRCTLSRDFSPRGFPSSSGCGKRLVCSSPYLLVRSLHSLSPHPRLRIGLRQKKADSWLPSRASELRT